LRDVTFRNCKLLGLQFSNCKEFLFSVNFSDCQLELASFYKMEMVGTSFLNCQLQEADFTETNLTSANFDGSDLSKAIFDRTNLEKADFRMAQGFVIDPEQNRVRKAKFSKENVIGLLYGFGVKVE